MAQLRSLIYQRLRMYEIRVTYCSLGFVPPSWLIDARTNTRPVTSWHLFFDARIASMPHYSAVQEIDSALRAVMRRAHEWH